MGLYDFIAQNTPFPAIKPLKSESQSLPEFAVSSFPEAVRQYVSAVAQHTQTAPDMAAVFALGTLAAALQGKFVVEGTPGYTEPLSLYCVVIAPPGERKSGVMNCMTKFLYQYEDEVNIALKPQIRQYEKRKRVLEKQIEELTSALGTSKAKTEVEKQLQAAETERDLLVEVKPVRYLADDCSSEALIKLLAKNDGILTVVSTEGGIFDTIQGRYSAKVNFDVWLKGHCGDPLRVDRLCRDADIVFRPTLSAILAMQPSVLDEIMGNATLAGRGLLARFLYSLPQSKIGTRVFSAPPVPIEKEEAYKELLYSLLKIERPKEAHILRLSQDAAERISEYFNEHEAFLRDEGQLMQGWASKYIGTILRIAGLLHLAEGNTKEQLIDRATMENAITIGKYFLAHSTCAYSRMGTELSIQKAMFVLSKLKKDHIYSIKRSELFRMCRGKYFKKVDEIASTLEVLESHGYIRLHESESKSVGRKPDVLVLVNPKCLE